MVTTIDPPNKIVAPTVEQLNADRITEVHYFIQFSNLKVYVLFFF